MKDLFLEMIENVKKAGGNILNYEFNTGLQHLFKTTYFKLDGAHLHINEHFRYYLLCQGNHVFQGSVLDDVSSISFIISPEECRILQEHEAELQAKSIPANRARFQAMLILRSFRTGYEKAKTDRVSSFKANF